MERTHARRSGAFPDGFTEKEVFMIDSEVLSIEKTGHVATLWLDRPERRNAFGPALWADLPKAMAALGADDDVRAVVLAARGPAFTVGLDLREMAFALLPPDAEAGARGRMEFYRGLKELQAAVSSVAACPKPILAAVHGYCIGAGVDLITACDVRLASADAVFSVRETRMALVADLGTLQRLPKIINPGFVAELAYTGKDITAARAREMGLVTGLFDDREALHAAAQAMAEEMAANSPLVVQGVKAVLRQGAHLSVEDALAYVALWNTSFMHSNDLAEAVTAFFEKRAPEFTGT